MLFTPSVRFHTRRISNAIYTLPPPRYNEAQLLTTRCPSKIGKVLYREGTGLFWPPGVGSQYAIHFLPPLRPSQFDLLALCSASDEGPYPTPG